MPARIHLALDCMALSHAHGAGLSCLNPMSLPHRPDYIGDFGELTTSYDEVRRMSIEYWSMSSTLQY